MRSERTIATGDGWRLFLEGDSAWIKFNHKPDSQTLARLRERASWDGTTKAWRAPRDAADALRAIGERAETWESVGEEPPSWLDDGDYSIFHD